MICYSLFALKKKLEYKKTIEYLFILQSVFQGCTVSEQHYGVVFDSLDSNDHPTSEL